METPAERLQLAKWTTNVRARLFSLSLLNKRQIAFTTACRTFYLLLSAGLERKVGPDRTTREHDLARYFKNFPSAAEKPFCCLPQNKVFNCLAGTAPLLFIIQLKYD